MDVKNCSVILKTNWNFTIYVINLQFLPEPYTTYKIWIEGIVDGRKTPSSEPILANTDVDQPSPPGLLNATCFDTGQIYVEWKRPDRFDKSVDYYKLYHKTVSEPTYKSVTIQANAKDDNLSVRNDDFITISTQNNLLIFLAKWSIPITYKPTECVTD